MNALDARDEHLLSGRIQSGKNDASHWLAKFHGPYCRKTGMELFPGSLNVRLDRKFDWYADGYQPSILQFGREEYGGERDILLLPCALPELGNRRGFLWSTTTAARDRPDEAVIEVITDVHLRKAYGLVDGDLIYVELILKQGKL